MRIQGTGKGSPIAANTKSYTLHTNSPRPPTSATPVQQTRHSYCSTMLQSTYRSLVLPLSHRRWKFKNLMAYTNTAPNRIGHRNTIGPITLRKSCRNPNSSRRYNCTGTDGPPVTVIGVLMSPNCEDMSPFTDQATGSNQ